MQRSNADFVRQDAEKVRQANEDRLREKRMVSSIFAFNSNVCV